MTRVSFLDRDSLPAGKQEYYDQIAARRGHVARPYAALLNSPEAASKLAAFGEELRYVSPAIPPEIREIVTLTTARVLNCEYIWTHHCNSSDETGVRREVIESIGAGGTPRGLLPKESVFVHFTRELLENKRIRDATYGAVEHLLGSQGAVDIILTIGYYTMLCLAVNALEVNLEDGVVPLLPAS